MAFQDMARSNGLGSEPWNMGIMTKLIHWLERVHDARCQRQRARSKPPCSGAITTKERQ